MPLLDHKSEPRERGIPRSLIIQLLVLCVLFGGVGFVYLQSMTRAQFQTGTTMGFHEQGLSVVHYGIAKYGGGNNLLDYLVFELVEKTQPDLQITPTPETGLFSQAPAYRVRAADGRHRPLPINPHNTGGEVFMAEPDGRIRPAGFAVTRDEWNQYFTRYRQIGDGNLSPQNLRAFVEKTRTTTPPPTQRAHGP
jgi:hypothetical protein